MGSKYLWQNKIYLFSFYKTKMMFKTPKLLGLILGLTVLIACDKEENELGDNLIHNPELNHFTSDSTAIITTYNIIDSVFTLNPDFPIIGSSNDVQFGKTNASLFSELHLAQNDISFGDNPVLDSIVLNLKYKNYFGDTTLNQHFQIYRLTEQLDTVKKYSNQNYATGEMLGDVFFTPAVQNITINGEDESISFLSQSLRLNDAFGTEILSKSGGVELSDNVNFTTYFNGLHIVPQNDFGLDQGTFFTIDYEASNIKLYYNNDVESDSLNFVFNTSTKSLNHYEHDYSNSNAETSLLTDTSTENLFIQSMAGMDVVVEFPDLSALDSTYINKAVLIIPRSEDTISNFDTYVRLRAEHFNEEEGKYESTIDEKTYGGGYIEEYGRYEFVITRYIQELINEKTTEKLYIRSQSNFSGAKTILNGASQSENGMKLHLTYSKEKN